MADFDSWKELTEQTEDGPLAIRARAALPPPMKRSRLPHLILVGWGYEPADDGQPAVDELRAMETFETAVAKALDDAGAGFWAACVTGQGAREWRYYTADPDGFMDALNDALEGHPEYPLEFQSFEDPEWNALAELLED